ncbi:MAG: HPF/RaiA family ribosome-associated protein [Candidatus Binatia bacterium]
MQTQLRITAHDVPLPEAAEIEIRKKVAKLESLYPRLVSCHVIVNTPARYPHDKTGLYSINIDLTAPGTELTVTRKEAADLMVAIHKAFDAARRQVRNYAHRQRGDVKVPETPPHGVITKLFSLEGYGFLETWDGREIYFHRNSVLENKFDELEIGDEVRFAEEQGERGPQASTVALVAH